jgi:predicted HNH restriction endonuclease
MFINKILIKLDLSVYKASHVKKMEDRLKKLEDKLKDRQEANRVKEVNDGKKKKYKDAKKKINTTWRKLIRKLHPNICWNCDIEGSEKVVLDVHHIVPITDDPSQAMEPKNTVLLCQKCHTQYHKDRNLVLDIKKLDILA